jgi:hypothetical protein
MVCRRAAAVAIRAPHIERYLGLETLRRVLLDMERLAAERDFRLSGPGRANDLSGAEYRARRILELVDSDIPLLVRARVAGRWELIPTLIREQRSISEYFRGGSRRVSSSSETRSRRSTDCRGLRHHLQRRDKSENPAAFH